MNSQLLSSLSLLSLLLSTERIEDFVGVMFLDESAAVLRSTRGIFGLDTVKGSLFFFFNVA
jgi:hypothetical protein